MPTARDAATAAAGKAPTAYPLQDAPGVAQEPGVAGARDALASAGPIASPASSVAGAPPAHARYGADLPPSLAGAQPAGAGNDAAGQTPRAAPQPPAAQVAPAMVQLATAPNGAQRLTVRLDPQELGQVEIRLERERNGPAQVRLTVHQPETLLLLMRDQAALHQALDQAGVPSGRSVQFHLAQPGSNSGTGAGGSFGATADGGGQSGGGRAWEGRDGGSGRGGRDWGTDASLRGLTAGAAEAGLAAQPGWRRAGLNITA